MSSKSFECFEFFEYFECVLSADIRGILLTCPFFGDHSGPYDRIPTDDTLGQSYDTVLRSLSTFECDLSAFECLGSTVQHTAPRSATSNTECDSKASIQFILKKWFVLDFWQVQEVDQTSLPAHVHSFIGAARTWPPHPLLNKFKGQT